MSNPFLADDLWPPALALHVEEVCCRFEEALKAGQNPLVEEFLSGAHGEESSILRLELEELQQAYRKSHSTVCPAQAVLDTPSGSGEKKLSQQQIRNMLAPPQEKDELGRFGPYRVLQVLGSGGMGVVFQAEDIHLRRAVALKVMKPALADDEKSRQRFLREAQSAAGLEHDHIVTIYQVGDDRGVPYLAMQLLHGESLAERIKRQPKLPVNEILQIGRQLAEGLAAAHDRGLIHRDIKPSNIWLESLVRSPLSVAETSPAAKSTTGQEPRTTDYRVKILDFGLARVIRDDVHLTESGMIVGTPAYMAPEQAQSKNVGRHSDLFSLGSVLYRLCTGELPFRGDTTMAVLTALAVDKPRPVRELNADIPDGLAELVMQLLAKNPDDRPASALEVVETIKSIERSQQAPAATQIPACGFAPETTATIEYPAPVVSPARGLPSSKPEAQARRRRIPRILLIAASLLIAAVIGYAAIQTFRATFATPYGTFIVDITDPKIEARFKNGRIHIYDINGKLKYTLSAGERNEKVTPGKYRIKGPKDLTFRVFDANGAELDTNAFTMKKDGRVVLRVTLRPPVVAAKKDPDRHAAEWVLGLGGHVNVEANGLGHEIHSVKDLPSVPFKLIWIYLRSDKVDDSSLEHLRGLWHLQTLLLHQTKITDKGLERLSQMPALSHLNGLGLGNSPITDTGLLHLFRFKDLRDLNLMHTTVTDAGVSDLKRLKNLTGLTLTGTRITDTALKHLKQLSNLTHLHIGQTKVTDAGLAELKGLRLRNVTLWYNKTITDEGMKHLRDITTLAFLDLNHTSVGDNGLAHLKKLTNLESLDLSQTRVTAAGLSHINRLKRLKQLVLYRISIRDTDLEKLINLKNLDWLYLEAKDLTAAGISHITEFKKLKKLQLHSVPIDQGHLQNLKGLTSLESIQLNHTKLSDAGLGFLAGMTNLTYADLSYTLVSDAGLKNLNSLDNLRELNLTKTKVTLKGVKKLQAALPNCKIVWDGNTDLDRRAAEWVVSVGGTVNVRLEKSRKGLDYLSDLGALPDEAFRVTAINLYDKKPVAYSDFQRLIDLKELSFLSLRQTEVRGAGAEFLKGLTRLQGLSIHGSPLTDDALKSIGALSNLTVLSLAYRQISDESLKYLSGLTNLSRLNLYGTNVTGSGLEHIKNTKRLSELHLHLTPLTDVGLEYLKELTNLKLLRLHGTQVTDGGLKHLIGLTQLEVLTLDNTKVTAAGIAALQKALPNCKITSDGKSDPDRRAAEWVLSIGGWVRIKQNGKLRQLMKGANLPKEQFDLVEVSLYHIKGVSDAGLAHFKDCKNITSLNLQNTQITDAGLAHFKDCQKLTHLVLNGTLVTDAGLAHFKECNNLTHLALAYTQLTDEGLAYFHGCKNLTHLYLRTTRVGDAGLAYFKHCKKLKTLHLLETRVSDVGLAYFRDCKSLLDLDLANTQVSDAGLVHFKDCNKLMRLILNGTSVTDAGLVYFKDCTHLEYLGLTYTQVTDAGLAHFKDCKNVKVFSVVNSHVTDAGLAHFKHCTKFLDIRLNKQVTDAGLAHFKDCKNLTMLALGHTQVTDEGLAFFKDCNHIEGLVLNHTRVTDGGLAHFKNCKNLTYVNLLQTPVTDAGVAHFRDCKNLTKLNLANTQVSDASLEQIICLPRLETLDLTRTRISAAGHELLKRAMPNCSITWYETNRVVAEQVLSLGGTVHIATPNQVEARPIKTVGDLPKGYFQVRRVSLAGVKKLLGNLPQELAQLGFPKFDRLEALDLSGTTLRDFSFLAPIRGLRELTLARADLTDAEVKQLPKLPALERLVLGGKNIRGLGLMHLHKHQKLIDLTLNCPSLTDLTADRLALLNQLKRLSLAGSGLSDKSVPHLAKLINLEMLNVSQTKITPAGVAALQIALRKCKIVRDEAEKKKTAM